MSIAEVVISPDVPDALAVLRRNGFCLVMVNNQPNIARRTQSRESVYAINRHLQERLGLDAVDICEHDDVGKCDCRKSQAGNASAGGQT
jgi:histidinol phosphatase-like enzyme